MVSYRAVIFHMQNILAISGLSIVYICNVRIAECVLVYLFVNIAIRECAQRMYCGWSAASSEHAQ